MRTLVEDIITSAIKSAIESGELPLDDLPSAQVERPRDLAHGDWASSIAMRCAKQAHMNPRDIAQIIVAHIADAPEVASVEIAGPGFINIKLSDAALQSVFHVVRSEDTRYGSSHDGDGIKVDL